MALKCSIILALLTIVSCRRCLREETRPCEVQVCRAFLPKPPVCVRYEKVQTTCTTCLEWEQ
jgi:hypothetical protein